MPRRAGIPRRAAGFTLLEAVVALVVFAVAGGALYGLFGTNLTALGRSGDVAAQAPVVRQALARLAVVNPWHEPEGAFVVDGHQVSWRAQLVAPARQGQSPVGTGDYDLALYDVQLEVVSRGRRLGVWQTRLVGYDRVRMVQDEAR